MTQLYLVRHGETDLNKRGVYCGWTDCELNKKGVSQAITLSKSFKDTKFDIVISSSLKRTIDTGAYITGLDKNQIIKDDRLNEINFGQWEGLHFNEVKERYKDSWEQWSSDWKTTQLPQGESYIEFKSRVSKCLDDILIKYKGKRILIVSHLGCLKVMHIILKNLQDDAFWILHIVQGDYDSFDI